MIDDSEQTYIRATLHRIGALEMAFRALIDVLETESPGLTEKVDARLNELFRLVPVKDGRNLVNRMERQSRSASLLHDRPSTLDAERGRRDAS